LEFFDTVVVGGKVAAEPEVLVFLGRTQAADFHQVGDHSNRILQGGGMRKGISNVFGSRVRTRRPERNIALMPPPRALRIGRMSAVRDSELGSYPPRSVVW
jgi:hypothetical protein